MSLGSIPLSQKISPLIKISSIQSPVVPILVEGTPSTFNDILAIFDTLHLNVYQSIPTFGFVAGLGTKEHIIDIAAQREVLMVHPDLTNYGLSQPPTPFSITADPFSIVNTMFDSTLGELNRNFSKNIFDNLLSKNLMNLGSADMSSGLPPMPPMPNNLPMPPLPPPFGNMSSNSFPTPLSMFGATQNPNQGYQAALDEDSADWGYSTAYTRTLLGVDRAEEVGITGKGVKVCVLDTGVNLNTQQVPTYTDFDDAMTVEPAVDENGHGTHCFTIAMGLGTVNYRNIALKGMAVDAHPIAIKVLGGGIGTGRDSDILKGMEMAYLKSANIVSMSLGSNNDNPQSPLCRAVSRLTQEGMIFCIAAGNSGSKAHTIGTPGTAEDAITVGAVSPKDNSVASFSSRGTTVDGRIKPDISSYGVDIYSSTSRGSLLDGIGDHRIDGFAKLSGTSMACFPANTVIALENCYEYINKIVAKQTLPTYKDKKCLIGSTATDAIPQGEKLCYTVKTKYSSIEATFDHPIFGIKKNLMPIDQRTGGLESLIEEIPLIELENGDWILTINGAGFNGKDIEHFKNWNNDQYKFLGMFLADGNLQRSQICISQKKDRLTFKEYFSIAKTYFGAKQSDSDTNDRFWINNTELRNIFEDILYKNGIKDPHLNIANLPLTKLKYFLQGFFDGNGWITGKSEFKYQIGFSAPENVLTEIKLALFRFGIFSSNVKKQKKKSHIIKTAHKEYMISGIDTYIIITGVNARKYIKTIGSFVKIFPEIENTTIQGHGIKGIRNFTDDFHFERIYEIEKSTEKFVYDLRIEPDHNFVANNMVVHNTPHMAGFLALVKEAYPDANTTSIKQVFANKGHTKNNDYGWGVATWSWFEGGLRK